MTTPSVNIDQLRRQFPQEVVRYFDAVVEAKFAEVDWRLQDIEDTLEWWETEIPQIAQSAADQAEQDFIQQALSDLVTELQPYISQAVSTDLRNWVYNSKPGSTARYKFYIDSQENIEALAERENWTIYIGTDEEPDESSPFVEIEQGSNPTVNV